MRCLKTFFASGWIIFYVDYWTLVDSKVINFENANAVNPRINVWFLLNLLKKRWDRWRTRLLQFFSILFWSRLGKGCSWLFYEGRSSQTLYPSVHEFIFWTFQLGLTTSGIGKIYWTKGKRLILRSKLKRPHS